MILEQATIDDLTDPSMLLAASEATKSSLRFRLGAVIRKGKRILGKGYNVKKTHPRFGCGRWRTLHAEAYAIYCGVRQGNDLRDSTLFVFRSGGLVSRPCPDCQQLIKKYRIKRVIYS